MKSAVKFFGILSIRGRGENWIGAWGDFFADAVFPGGTSNVESNESDTKPGSFFVSPRLGVAFRF